GAITRIDRSGVKSSASARFQGVAGASGIAIGHAVVMSPPADLHSVPSRPCADPDLEIAFFYDCLAAVRNDMQELGAKLATRLAPQEQALFDVYLRMLDDSALASEVVERIRQGEWAQGALSQVVLSHVRTFES